MRVYIYTTGLSIQVSVSSSVSVLSMVYFVYLIKVSGIKNNIKR